MIPFDDLSLDTEMNYYGRSTDEAPDGALSVELRICSGSTCWILTRLVVANAVSRATSMHGRAITRRWRRATNDPRNGPVTDVRQLSHHNPPQRYDAFPLPFHIPPRLSTSTPHVAFGCSATVASDCLLEVAWRKFYQFCIFLYENLAIILL